ncbi:MAG: hypothetical protein H0U13_13235 [Gemmatimonadaceae bacterium]|nr:hypothetical protein [Gemmatimonadaceae bacterium]
MRERVRTVTRARRGLSVMELIVGMVILGIIGMAITRVLVSQARYFDHQKTANLARSVSRGPLNRVVSDLRMVEAQGGIVAASNNSILARVPFAIGVVCAMAPDSSGTHVSLLPVDSAMYATAGFSGYAWRDGQGIYAYVESGPPSITAGNPSICTGANVQTLTASNAKVIKISPRLDTRASVGTAVLLFQRLQYQFKTSTSVPGSLGLFRTVVATGLEEELSAPFNNDAKFRFFIKNDKNSQGSAPASLGTLRGILLELNGQSEYAPSGASAKKQANFRTAVFFKNRLD